MTASTEIKLFMVRGSGVRALGWDWQILPYSENVLNLGEIFFPLFTAVELTEFMETLFQRCEIIAPGSWVQALGRDQFGHALSENV